MGQICDTFSKGEWSCSIPPSKWLSLRRRAGVPRAEVSVGPIFICHKRFPPESSSPLKTSHISILRNTININLKCHYEYGESQRATQRVFCRDLLLVLLFQRGHLLSSPRDRTGREGGRETRPDPEVHTRNKNVVMANFWKLRIAHIFFHACCIQTPKPRLYF